MIKLLLCVLLCLPSGVSAAQSFWECPWTREARPGAPVLFLDLDPIEAGLQALSARWRYLPARDGTVLVAMQATGSVAALMVSVGCTSVGRGAAATLIDGGAREPVYDQGTDTITFTGRRQNHRDGAFDRIDTETQ